MASIQEKPFLLDQPPSAWDLGAEPAYRRDQLVQWVFEKRVESFHQMLNLPQSFRKKLEETYLLKPLELAKTSGSSDTTLKYLWSLSQGDYIESVLIPASVSSSGEQADRMTLCVSSQVGCAYGCKFCASGLEGWKRNLSPAEIISQIIEAERVSGQKIQNLVFMGMGEPLANLKNLLPAIEMIHSPQGLNIGARHITLSTSGLVPQILELAKHPLQLRLAISLHGATNDVRSQIMPINRKYPLEELLSACREYVSTKRKIITFEYILIEGINDMLSEAKELAKHARALKAKVNLIPYNRVEGLTWKRPEPAVIQIFTRKLEELGVNVTLRTQKGIDIDAACGQLRLKQLKNVITPSEQVA